jgi:two-component system nitrate/nitrite response regulator NarL
MIKIIVFSDIRIYCEGLCKILSSIEQFNVVSSESHFQDAIDKVKHTDSDVVLLDLTMSGSCQMAKQILQHCPHVQIVALAASKDEKKVINCAEAGIAGCVEREATLDVLIETVKCVMKGEVYYPPRIATYIFNQFCQFKNTSNSADLNAAGSMARPSLSTLTSRERQIVTLVAEGQSNKKISRSLSIEVSTVKNHVHNILVKLNVKSRVQVVTLIQQTSFQRASPQFN